MSKSSSKDLFHLIKALSKSEKRYFKLYASRHNPGAQNQYVKLFDAIARQTEYNEEKLLKKETYINSLTQLKGRLYETVLKSLELHNAESTAPQEIRSLISQADLLYDKELPRQALKLLQKAKEIAEENDEFTYQMEISGIEGKIRAMLVDRDWLSGGLDESIEYEKKAIEKFENFQKYRLSGAGINLWGSSNNQPREAKDFNAVESIKHFSILENEKNALSLKALISHLYQNGLVHYINQDVPSGFDSFNKVKKLIEKDPLRKKKYGTSYIFVITNMINCGDKILSYNEMLELIESLREMSTLDPPKETDLLRRYYHSLMAQSVGYKKFEQALEHADQTAQWLQGQEEPLKSSFPYGMGLYYHISHIYFLHGQYKKSLQWLNKIINAHEDDALFFHTPSKIFSIIIHYELDNKELLEYIVKSVYRHLYRRNKLYKFESSVLNFIRNKMPKADDKKGLKLAFKELHSELVNISKDPLESKPLHFFDFISWLESKIEDKPMIEVLKARKG